MKGDIPLFDLSNPQPDPTALGVRVGPGSQVEEQALTYLTMPKEMDTFDIPMLPEHHEISRFPLLDKLLDELQNALDLRAQVEVLAAETGFIALDVLEPEACGLLYQTLGDGEVAIVINADDNNEKIRVQETSLAGVWWLQKVAADDSVISQWIEVGAIPTDVELRTRKSDFNFDQLNENLPADILNAGPVIYELLDKAKEHYRSPRSQAHVINLSLLPFPPEDHVFLYERLGHGKVSVLSRGYGNCRITSTEVPGIWRVQYFNSTDQLILDTFEVITVPQVACAAIEDIEDSAQRLREIHEALK